MTTSPPAPRSSCTRCRSFFLGIILIQIFAISFPILNFEASQSTNIWVVIGDWHSMLLPILTLTLITVATFSRYMRSSSIDVLAQDYIKVARAKGLPERLVLTRHLVRNASLPMITLVGLVPAGPAGRKPDRRDPVQLPGPGPAVLQQPG